VLSVSPTELGTTEEEWLSECHFDAVELLTWTVGRPIVVVAPHPDDETLGAGGLLQEAHRSGSPILVVAVTDGEASHPGSHLGREVLGARRRQETVLALQRLGLHDVDVIRCGLPDGEVALHEWELVLSLRGLVDRHTVLITTWRHDSHPDHEATGRAVASVAAASGVRLLEFPIWAWRWATPAHGMPLFSARRREVGPADLAAKRHAIQAYRSQIEPIGPAAADRTVLPPTVRARFERPFELFFEATPE